MRCVCTYSYKQLQLLNILSYTINFTRTSYVLYTTSYNSVFNKWEGLEFNKKGGGGFFISYSRFVNSFTFDADRNPVVCVPPESSKMTSHNLM